MNVEINKVSVRAATSHLPVLPQRVKEVFSFAHGRILDATAGGGGHTRILLELGHEVVAIDRDPFAVERLRNNFNSFLKTGKLSIKKMAFADCETLGEFDGIIADIGLSSDQLLDDTRGFSFNSNAPLDMRMDPSLSISASELILNSSTEELTSILHEYGEEPYAWRIARAISGKRFETSIELAEAVRSVKKRRKSRLDPATLTFQALRIYVNDELNQLRTFLSHIPKILKPSGRLAVISFHSLEDKIVKNKFSEWFGKCVCPPRIPECRCGAKRIAYPLWNGVIKADINECNNNPRARSARMRALKMNDE